MAASNTTFFWRHGLTLHSSLSPFESPLASTHQAFKGVQPMSWKRINVAGILVTVYGLEELPREPGDIVCAWLLHGRSDTQDSMAVIAAAFMHAWKSRRRQGQKRLICVAFDQRNHGSRMIDNTANVSWREGNPTHGPDMFALYSGTSQDVSLLLTHLPAYLPITVDEHMACGVSLGGHATWQLMVNEPQITAGIVFIGCPDYVGLMTDRAKKSKLPSYVNSNPPGSDFLGCKDFPPSLIHAVQQYDPAGVLLGELHLVPGDEYSHPRSESEKTKLRSIMTEKLAGKKILCLSGAKDKLVPYAQGKPFLTWLKAALDPQRGWFADQKVELEDVVDPDGNHACSVMMRDKAEKWLCDFLSGQSTSSSELKSKL